MLLSILDLLGVYTHMDASILNALKDLSALMATKHLRVQRKAKQIGANCQNNIVEQNKDLVLPSLRSMSNASMSEEQEVAMVEGLVAEHASRVRTDLPAPESYQRGLRVRAYRQQAHAGRDESSLYVGRLRETAPQSCR